MHGPYALARHTCLRTYCRAMATQTYGTNFPHGRVTAKSKGVTQGYPNWDHIREQTCPYKDAHRMRNAALPSGCQTFYWNAMVADHQGLGLVYLTKPLLKRWKAGEVTLVARPSLAGMAVGAPIN